MYHKNKILTETAEKRLSAIREFTDLGSGFKISMQALELRGAGNLLGAEQHGHMADVGYDMYCKMLTDAVREAKGEEDRSEFETAIDLNVNAYIPDSYIENESQKLDIYKRISMMEDEKDYDDMMEELLDRFGEMPKPVLTLLSVARLKMEARKAYVTEIKQIGHEIRISMYPEAKIDPARIPMVLNRYRRRIRFKTDKEPVFFLKAEGKLLEDLSEFCRNLSGET
jgi:transcription-repair coupling factor (superfamily II helicase)